MKIRISFACVLALSGLLAAPVLAQNAVPRPKPTWRAVGTGGFSASKVRGTDFHMRGPRDGSLSHSKVHVAIVKSKIAPGAKLTSQSRYRSAAVQGFSKSLNGIRTQSQSRPIKFSSTPKYRPQAIPGSR